MWTQNIQMLRQLSQVVQFGSIHFLTYVKSNTNRHTVTRTRPKIHLLKTQYRSNEDRLFTIKVLINPYLEFLMRSFSDYALLTHVIYGICKKKVYSMAYCWKTQLRFKITYINGRTESNWTMYG